MYKWVLNTFLEALSDKKPCSTLTDRDKAIRRAIKEVLTMARHSLCSWHLHRICIEQCVL